jgi:importin-5
MLLLCGKESRTLTAQMVSVIFVQLVPSIGSETEPSLLSSLLGAFSKCVKIIDGPTTLPREVHDGLIESLMRQLEKLADRRKNRAPLTHEPPAIDFGISSSDLENIDINTLKLTFDLSKFEMDNFDISAFDTDERI